MQDPGRHKQDEDIGCKDDGRRADCIGARVDTFTRCVAVPVFRDRTTLEDARERGSNGEAAVQDKSGPQTAIDPFVGRS